MTAAPARALLWLAFGLAVVVVTASSGLRLAANGLGCEPWPRCYGSPATASAVQQMPEARAARLTHRVAASAFVVAMLGAVLFGWRRWSRPARTVAGFLLAITALLSIVGRYTPSTVPAVTLINVVGGLALLCGTAFLLATRPCGPVPGRTRRGGLYALLLLALMQAAIGAMISTRSAGAACADGCSALRAPVVLTLLNPLVAGSASEVGHSAQAGQVLHQMHRLLALLVTILSVVIVAAAPRRIRGPVLVALAGCLLPGIVLASSDGSLGAAVAHALGAGAFVSGLAVLLSCQATRRQIE